MAFGLQPGGRQGMLDRFEIDPLDVGQLFELGKGGHDMKVLVRSQQLSSLCSRVGCGRARFLKGLFLVLLLLALGHPRPVPGGPEKGLGPLTG
jgi:hypothetical protein